MDKQTLFDLWAPAQGVWSPWAKPVLFAHWPRPLLTRHAVPSFDLSAVAPAAERSAIVVEMPGAEAVAVGLALAERGYRPVPLFNACPPPWVASAGPVPAIIDVDSILAALVDGAARLSQVTLPKDAPPAFLIDAHRQRPLQPGSEGWFDNRSVLFVTDFPSATFLGAQGITQVLLLREGQRHLEGDLAYVLRTWQRAGMRLASLALNQPGSMQPLTIGGSWLLFHFWHRFTTWFRFRRNPLGGFGGFLPEASSG